MMQKLKIKIDNKYIFLFFIFLLLAILQAFQCCGVFDAILSYFIEPGYRENYALVAWGIDRDVNLFEVIVDFIHNYKWEFDYMMIFSTNLFQILLPCLVSVFGLFFYEKYTTIYQSSFYRTIHYKKYMLKQIIKESTHVAITIFLSYFTFYVMLLLISRGNMFGDVGRQLFIDIVGVNFYYNHTLFYYLFLDGAVRFFLVPFIYTFLSCAFATIFTSPKKVFLMANGYYYGLCMIGAVLSNVIGTASIYINPSTIMASGAYNTIYTIPLLCMQLLPIIIGYCIISLKEKKMEI